MSSRGSGDGESRLAQLSGRQSVAFAIEIPCSAHSLGCVGMASILAARKLAQYDGGTRVPATINAVADAVRWAEQIMVEIDRRRPLK
jgi:hypothetical protein